MAPRMGGGTNGGSDMRGRGKARSVGSSVWETRANVEVGEVLEHAGKRHIVTARHEVGVDRQDIEWVGGEIGDVRAYFLYGAYEVVEEKTGFRRTLRFAYEVPKEEAREWARYKPSPQSKLQVLWELEDELNEVFREETGR